MPHLYDNPPSAVAFADGLTVPENLLIEAINHFEDFYEEVFMELAKYGEIEDMHVCDNIGEHLIGNVYVKYFNELDTDKAMKALSGRFYSGKQIKVEFSPVTDFKESRCRLFKEGSCDRKFISLTISIIYQEVAIVTLCI
jgi:splicing factor U2AF subunit